MIACTCQTLSPPHPALPPVAAFTPQGLHTRLASAGIAELLAPLAEAEAHEDWVLHDLDDRVMADVRELYGTLSRCRSPLLLNQEQLPGIATDLTYLLAYLRMSHCLQLLAAFNSTVPGLAERLLVRASTPLIKDGSEAAILSNRLLYLIRQHCVREILSPRAALRSAGRHRPAHPLALNHPCDPKHSFF